MELDIREATGREDLLFVDVRSPREYARTSIPGSVNIPLFQDEEHRHLGLLYHSHGEKAARQAALELVGPRLSDLVKQITGAAGNKTPLLYCWRGGLRSNSLYQILSFAGIQSYRLKGGYKAFRRYVYSRLCSYSLKGTMLVLHGLTGVGKTAVIHKLIRHRLPALDLEGLANHRGSVFGTIGTGPPNSQKDFDALLLQRLDALQDPPCLVVEGEGRRIGDIHLPLFLSEAMVEGKHILLTAPLENRVERIVSEYLPGNPTAEDLGEISRAVVSLRRRLGETKTGTLLQQLQAGNYPSAVELLCREYYDCLYSDSKPDRCSFAAVVDATDPSAAADQIAEMIIHNKGE